MTVRPKLGSFEHAVDAAETVGGGSFSHMAEPFTMSRFAVASHESTAYSKDYHSFIFAVRSSGFVEMELGGSKGAFATDPGTLTFAPANAEQAYAFDGKTDNIMLSLHTDFIERLLPDWDGAEMGKLEPLPLAPMPRVKHLMLEMQRTLKTGGIGGDIAAEAMAMQATVELFRHFSEPQKTKSNARIQGNERSALDDFIETYLDTQFSLSDLADRSGMDVFSFSRAFKAAYGTTPGRYIMQRRVERACRLLRDSDLGLVEIALTCGFSSQAHLTTSFTKHIGVPPGRYRREVRL